LRRADGWPQIAGQRRFLDELPFPWRVALSAQGIAKSLHLSPAALAGTPYESFSRVMAFPLIVQQEVQGVVVCATSPQLDPTAVELVETLVGHTALTVANAAMVEKVERQAITDGLTGVYNRRYFNDRLVSEMQRSLRYGHPLSLIILDIDFFKVANDVLGHLGGDAVLKQLATLLKDKVRKVDIVAHVAERIRGWIEEFPFSDQERLPHKVITASLGVSTYPEHGSSMDDLIHAADEALYQAKQAGRNRVGRIPSAQKA
jgi:GGDEF domain-containing protein